MSNGHMTAWRTLMEQRFGEDLAHALEQHKPLIKRLVNMYTPEELIELGTALVLEGTEGLKRGE